MVHNMTLFCGEEFSESRPTPKMEAHPLSTVRDCLFNILAVTLHAGGHSSICNLRTRHAVVTETHLWQYHPCDVLMFHTPLRTTSDMALYSINRLVL
jgi:hypothetical protein